MGSRGQELTARAFGQARKFGADVVIARSRWFTALLRG
jgi:hypothetical protein